MATTPVQTHLSVEEYLHTTYRPDRDYVDGEVQERNMGELPHARLQTYFVRVFLAHEEQWQIEVLQELRVQVAPKRFRIPDVLLAALPNTDERIVRTPPILCVEILSSEDRMSRIGQRIDDYARMGVRACWVVDPWRYTAHQAGSDGILHPEEDRLTVPNAPIAVAVADIFAELDRLKARATLGSQKS